MSEVMAFKNWLSKIYWSICKTHLVFVVFHGPVTSVYYMPGVVYCSLKVPLKSESFWFEDL